MKLLKSQYNNLKPNADFLHDPHVLGLAWKRTQHYVRTTNWYADLLELDKTCLNIEFKINEWVNDVRYGSFSCNPLELIPAPKSGGWNVSNNIWQPETCENNTASLRPLAHISIRDQSVATAVMMCVADAVESKQKDCSLGKQTYADHQKGKVYSYGNRLSCDWEGDSARFRWGGSEFYRRFSIDYKTFLQRACYVGRETQKQVSAIDEVFIVSLDISDFFNNISIELLISKLKVITSEYYRNDFNKYNQSFWSKAQQSLSWDWSETAATLARTLNMANLDGIPQGLASAGLFANAYLIEFDNLISSKLGKSIPDSKVFIHDYCRYVDDLRLVVSGESIDKNSLKSLMYDFINGLLQESANCTLELNNRKTKVFEISDVDSWSSLANRVNDIQVDIGSSSVADRTTLEQNIPALQSLLTYEANEDLSSFSSLAPWEGEGDSLIRIDSLRRFSANRLKSSLDSMKKILLDSEKRTFDNESIAIAKKMLNAWLKDPSVMILFRKAMEVYPSVNLYESILSEVFKRATVREASHDKYCMIYILADIFRSISDIHRLGEVVGETSYKDLLDCISMYAQKILSMKVKLPPYVYHQALFFLATINRPHLDRKACNKEQVRLHKVLSRSVLTDFTSEDSALFELAAQITGQFDSYAAFLIQHLGGYKDRINVLETFAKNGGEFWSAIWRELHRKQEVKTLTRLRWAIPLIEAVPSGKRHFLSSICSFSDNPFKYEHSLIKLGIGLINLVEENPSALGASPHEVLIKLDPNGSWNGLWKENTRGVTCEFESKEAGRDPRYGSPGWLAGHQDILSNEKIIYWVCSLLRAAALGNTDFTQRNDIEVIALRYQGIRSNWFKRQIGMLHSPESLVGCYATISDWFTNLLKHGLQWPGFASTHIEELDITGIEDILTFKGCLESRLAVLNRSICKSSEIPTLTTVVNRPNLGDKLFRVVTVQQLLPKSEQFHKSDVTLDNANVRAAHREHLAAICRLTEQTLEAKLKADDKLGESAADLIVFAEVAVHPKDEDLLRSLAYKTNSIVFAGFVFHEYEGKIVNKARWIIPDYTDTGIQWRLRDQGKYHMTNEEIDLGVEGYRPCQHIIEVHGHSEGPFRLTGSICYDATDICLAADLKNKTDMFVISAYNKDVNTFDNMASALQWHMYQHVVISNIGQFGGSTIQAPFKEQYDRLISHVHGVGQISINTADVDLAAFNRKLKQFKPRKTRPAGTK
ncbi:RNA-directed DNA polymerase [Shewanella sp. SM55]|uniref:RNA-directed DNA polymerase n=1 Tax=Shewanella sp. SM55 TaxID=2912800 RepID=UPI0021D92466|nr:RNA-directed DNA polymerase [Shewanella sp. SM55]MCU8063388.1 RNA-directed DNA polymerase [Shewanella sp. SM55]